MEFVFGFYFDFCGIMASHLKFVVWAVCVFDSEGFDFPPSTASLCFFFGVWNGYLFYELLTRTLILLFFSDFAFLGFDILKSLYDSL